MSKQEISFVVIGDLGYDKITTSKGSRKVVAGAVYNVAVGSSVVADPETAGVVARVGGDFGEGISRLRKRGINTEGIEIVKNGKTTVFNIIENSDNSRAMQVEQGVSYEAGQVIFPDSYRRVSYVHLASSHPEKVLKWANFIKANLPRDIPLSVDANDLFIRDDIDATVAAIAKADFVFINELELAIIKERYSDFEIAGPMILKKGSKGAVYIDMQEGIDISIDAPLVNVVDTTGAGDTLAGVFIASRLKNIDIKKSLQRAVILASKAVTDFGVEHINPVV